MMEKIYLAIALAFLVGKCQFAQVPCILSSLSDEEVPKKCELAIGDGTLHTYYQFG